jgi:hypothetical protein
MTPSRHEVHTISYSHSHIQTSDSLHYQSGCGCFEFREISKKRITFRVFYGIRKSITVSTRAQDQVSILSEMNAVHTLTPYLKCILILSSYLCLDLPNRLFPSGSPTTIVHIDTCLVHLIFLAIVLYGEEWVYKI